VKISADIRFSTVPEWLIYSEVSSNAVRLYAVLDRHADKTGKAVPGQARIAKLMHASPRTVRRAIEELENIGALTVGRGERDETGELPVNEYVLHPAPRKDTGALPPTATGALGVRPPAPINESSLNERTPEQAGADIAPRPRDPAFDALASETGSDLQGMTRSAARATGVALAEIAQAEGSRRHLHGPAPHDLELAEEIAYRAGAYRRLHPDWQLTAPSLAKYWATLRVKTVEKVQTPGQSLASMRNEIPDDEYDPGEPISAQYARLKREKASRQAAESAPDQAGGVEAAPPAAEGSRS
jgi:helix-turn-helix protein